ncbi:hypothetical protein C8R44DRAFT_803327 [Mycena epipterygia]|nr:hypothetical protein C8R44DRAFT_803327 [Mycena epipterygia]
MSLFCTCQGARILSTLKRVNRVGLFIPSPIWAVPALGRFNSSESRRLSSSFGLREPASLEKNGLPAAPAPSTKPLLDWEWEDYLGPLYTRGWGFAYDYAAQQEPALGPVVVLRRTFIFRFFTELVTFSANTQNATSGNIFALRGLQECDVYLRSPAGVARSLIHLAIETENEYKKIVGDESEYMRPYVNPVYHIMSPTAARPLALKYSKPRTIKPGPPLVPLTPVVLPPAPPIPASPPPSITEADLKTYIEPLVTNGWCIAGVKAVERFSAAREALKGLPSLNRVYRFHDYTSARQFFHAVVAAIPPPTRSQSNVEEDVQAGVEVRLTAVDNKIEVWSISELAESERKPYGVSLADVRFAIEIETEFEKTWAGRAKNTAIEFRRLPKTIGELWDYRSIGAT